MDFAKRNAGILRALVSGANPDTFQSVAAIGGKPAEKAEPEQVASVVGVLEMMGYVEVQTGPDGAQSIRLTPDGVTLAASQA